VNEESKNKHSLDPNKSALLVSRDQTYHHNLSTIAEKVGRVTMIPVRQAYIFLRRFANKEAGGATYGINKKIARELNLKPESKYIVISLNNVHKQFPSGSIRLKAWRKDFKTAQLSKAHQAMLTLMFIKTVNPDIDMEKVKRECAELFDSYLPDISMIANGELMIIDADEGSSL